MTLSSSNTRLDHDLLRRVSSDLGCNSGSDVILESRDIKAITKMLQALQLRKSHVLLPKETRIFYPLFAASNCIKIKPLVLVQLPLILDSSLQQPLLMNLVSDKQQIKKLLSDELSNNITFNKFTTFEYLLGFDCTVGSSDEYFVSSMIDYFILILMLLIQCCSSVIFS